jgi:hypothetical protein
MTWTSARRAEARLTKNRRASSIRCRAPGTPTIETHRDRGRRPCASAIRGLEGGANAELSLDDLGLDVDSLETSGSLEDTTSLEKIRRRKVRHPFATTR